MLEREWYLADVTEQTGSHGSRKGGGEQDANSAEKGQRGGTPLQGKGSQASREGGALCWANGSSERIHREDMTAPGPFLTLLNNSKAFIKMFNVI